VLSGAGVEKGFAKDEYVSFFVEDKAKLDLHKRGYTLKAKVFIETISIGILSFLLFLFLMFYFFSFLFFF
jgi:hypothetical protein